MGRRERSSEKRRGWKGGKEGERDGEGRGEEGK